MSRLEFKESPVGVRVAEVLIWDFDTTPWAATPGSPVVTAVRTDTGADVTSTIFPSGSPSIVGTIYTLAPALGWANGVQYRITAQFESGGNTFRPYFLVEVSA